MLRLCKKCTSRLKKLSSDDKFETWQCSNEECKEIYKFPVEDKKDDLSNVEDNNKAEEEIKINVPKYVRKTNITPISQTKEEIKSNDNNNDNKIINVTKEVSQKINVENVSKETNKIENSNKKEEKESITKTDSNYQSKYKRKTQQVVGPQPQSQAVQSQPQSQVVGPQVAQPQQINIGSATNNLTDNVKNNGNVKPTILTGKISHDDRKITTQYDDLDESITDEEMRNSAKVYEYNEDRDVNDIRTLDLDAEDTKFPIYWGKEDQFISEQINGRRFQQVIRYICPFCGSKKINLNTNNILECQDCKSIFNNDSFKTEFYSALMEACKVRQKANFLEAEGIVKEIIARYPNENMIDAYFSMAISQSNIIFRENVKTGRRFATVYEPCKTSFLENKNLEKALELAKNSSNEDKYKSLLKLAGDINTYFDNFSSMLKKNKEYTVFICYHQTRFTHDFAKNLLVSLSGTTRTFVVGRVGDILDEQDDVMSKIYYGLNTSKIMVILCSSKEDLMTPSVVWRYKSFMSVNREKSIIPILMNNMKREDLPEDLRMFEPIIADSDVMLNIQKRIHQILPKYFMTQDYIENRIDKIEDCIKDERYQEAVIRADRLLLTCQDNPYIYLYKLMATHNIKDEAKLSRVHETLKDSEVFNECKKYADEDLLKRLVNYEVKNEKIQEIRIKEEKKEKAKENITNFFTKPSMQYLYTTLLPIILGLYILLTKQSFNNIQSTYLIIIAVVILISTIVLIISLDFNKKTIVTLMVALVFLFGVTGIGRIEFFNNYGTLYKYDINEEEKTITLNLTNSVFASTQDNIEVVIPSTMEIYGETYTITKIGDRLFENCQSITKITIPSTVTQIGKYAFSNISAKIVFEEGSQMTILGEYSFANYGGYTTFKLPENLEVIGEHAFDNCVNFITTQTSNISPQKIVIPKNVKSIGEYAFNNVRCEIEFSENSILETLTKHSFSNYLYSGSDNKGGKLILPNSLKKIETDAFKVDNEMMKYYEEIQDYSDALMLEEIYTKVARENLVIGNFILFRTENYIVQPLIKIENGRYYKIYEYKKDILGNWLFSNRLTELTIPGGVTEMEAGCLNSLYNLTNLMCPILGEYSGSNGGALASYFGMIPKKLGYLCINNHSTTLGAYALYNCDNLKYVYISEDCQIESIGNYCFYGCVNMEYFGENKGIVVDGKQYTKGEYSILPTIKQIGDSAFKGCIKLKDLILPSNLEKVDVSAFENCSGITSVCVPNTLYNIGLNSFNTGSKFVVYLGYYKVDNNNNSFAAKLKSSVNDYLGGLYQTMDTLIASGDLYGTLGNQFTINNKQYIGALTEDGVYVYSKQ